MTNRYQYLLLTVRSPKLIVFVITDYARALIKESSSLIKYVMAYISESAKEAANVLCLSPRRPGFDPGSVHVGLVVERMALGQAFPRVLRFYPVNFFPPVLHSLEK